MALARQAKREAAGGRERFSNLSRLFVHGYAHVLAGEVDVSRHTVSVASLEPERPAPLFSRRVQC